MMSQHPPQSQPFHSTPPVLSTDDGAPTFKSMEGKLDPSLLMALDAMKYTHMTPVQSKTLSALPTFRSDWYSAFSFTY